MREAHTAFNQPEHVLFAAITHPAEFQNFKSFECLVKRQRITAIQYQPPHAIPPYGIPIVVALVVVMAVASVGGDDRWLTGNDALVLVKDFLRFCYGLEYLRSHHLLVFGG